MNNTLLPGYDRPITPVHIVDRELLKVAQDSARRRRNWQCANGLLRMAYGCEYTMNTTKVKALQLNNNDQIVDVDGLIKVTDVKLVIVENVVTYTATKLDGTTSKRWADMDTYFDKVVG